MYSFKYTGDGAVLNSEIKRKIFLYTNDFIFGEKNTSLKKLLNNKSMIDQQILLLHVLYIISHISFIMTDESNIFLAQLFKLSVHRLTDESNIFLA